MIFKITLNLVAGFFLTQTLSACSNVEQTAVPMSLEGQKRIRAQQEAKIKQEHNNQIRAMNYQIQEQNRLEQRELERLRAERAAQRNAKRAMPVAEENQNK